MKDGRLAKNPEKSQKAKRGPLKGIKDGIAFGQPGNPHPSPEAKRNGWLKRKTGMELARAILDLSFNDIPIEEGLKAKVAEFYNIPVEEVTIQLVLHYKQIQKASNGDTYAYQAFMNRALGMPKQVTEEIGNRTVINVNIEGEQEDAAPVIPIEGKVV